MSELPPLVIPDIPPDAREMFERLQELLLNLQNFTSIIEGQIVIINNGLDVLQYPTIVCLVDADITIEAGTKQLFRNNILADGITITIEDTGEGFVL